MPGPSFLATASVFLGLILLFIGERVVDPTGAVRAAVSGVGALVLVFATVLRGLRMARARQEPNLAQRAVVERIFLFLNALVLVSLVLYAIQSDIVVKLGAQALEREWPKLAGALAALWPALLTTALLPMLLTEMAYAAMAKAPVLELSRVKDALLSGLGLAAALIFAFSMMYVATVRDERWDVSYFRTARPGEATRKLVQTLTEPVKVTLFFAPANEVGEAVRGYFDDLKKESPKLEVESLDFALEPTKARELGVSSNGRVVISRGGRREQFSIGENFEKARGQLRTLDGEMQKRLLTVARTKKTIYYTQGHGERTERPLSSLDPRAPVGLLFDVLRAKNYDLRPLSSADGLGNELPSDAAAVLVLGPQQEMLPAEIESLIQYVHRGGRLLVALDPEVGITYESLLTPLGLSFSPVQLANDAVFARKTGQVSDRAILAAGTYSSHPSVTTNGRSRSPMFFLGSGSLEELKQHPAELSIDFSVRAHPATFRDANGNFTHDPPEEERSAWNLAAAVTRRPSGSTGAGEEGRAVVIADSDALADEVMRASAFRGNEDFVLDGVKWILGDEVLAGSTNTEVDVPIQRTRQEEMVWLFVTLLGGPALIVLAGLFIVRRHRRRGRETGKPEVVSPPAASKEAA